MHLDKGTDRADGPFCVVRSSQVAHEKMNLQLQLPMVAINNRIVC